MISCNTNQKSTKDFSTKLDVEPTVLFINSGEDNLVQGNEGTVIFIEKNSLVYENGSYPDTLVQLQIKEYYKNSSIISQPLTTVSDNGKLLKSGGMIRLDANADGKVLRLKKGKEIIIHFPKNGSKEIMDMFSGQTDESGNIVWKMEKTSKAKLTQNIVTWYTKYDFLDSPSLYQLNGDNIYDWIRDNFKLTETEKQYFLYKDINLHYTVNSNGEFENIHFKKEIRKNISKKYLKIMESAPKCRPYTIKGKPIDMPGWLAIGVNVIPPKYADNKSYLNKIREKTVQNKGKSINMLSKMELNYYIFNSKQMGWINCDKFLNDPNPKVNIVVSVADPVDDMLKFVFKDYKSFIAGRFENGAYYFDNIPKDKEITLMVLRYRKGKALVGFKEFISDNMTIDNIELREVTIDELNKELEKLN